MRADRAELDLFLAKVWRACLNRQVFAEAYAFRRAYDDLGWSMPEIIDFLITLKPADFVRNEARRSGPGLIWMFEVEHETQGAMWLELVFVAPNVVIVSLHLSDGEGEP